MSKNNKLYLLIGTLTAGAFGASSAYADNCDISGYVEEAWNDMGCYVGYTICSALEDEGLGEEDYQVWCDSFCSDNYPGSNSCQLVCNNTIEGTGCTFCDNCPGNDHSGKYTTNGGSTWTKCPKGRYCASSGGCTGSCTLCQTGTYSDVVGAASCAPCGAYVYQGVLTQASGTTDGPGADSGSDCYLTDGTYALRSSITNSNGTFSSIYISNTCWGQGGS